MRIFYRTVFLLFLSLIVSSCASIFNGRNIKIEIHTIPDSALVCVAPGEFVNAPLFLEVPRSKKDLVVEVGYDSLVKKIIIPSRTAPEFSVGNLFLWDALIPVGYIVDACLKKKKYAYDTRIVIDMRDPNGGYRYLPESMKGKSFLSLEFPFVNAFFYNKGKYTKQSWTPMGITAGINYYHSPHAFISISGSATRGLNTSFSHTRGDSVYRYIDSASRVAAYTIAFTNNHDLIFHASRKISVILGYGVSYSHLVYSENVTDSVRISSQYYRHATSTLGLGFTAGFIFGKVVTCGITYWPNLYTIEPARFIYSYRIAFSMGVRIPLNRQQKARLPVFRYNP